MVIRERINEAASSPDYLLLVISQETSDVHTNQIDLEVRDVAHLEKMMSALRAADAVNAVARP